MADATEGDRDSTWSRLRRRKVVQWGIAYAAGAWGLLQVLQFLADTYDWPSQILRIVTLVFALGLPIALVLAWYHGDKGQQRVTRTEFTILTLLLLLGGGLFWHYQRTSETSPASTLAAKEPATEASALPTDRSIAVLPFVNLSTDPEQEYFADGISEELLNLLAKIPELRVISRFSAFSFKGKNIPIQEVAKQLRVEYVLEGSIRKAGDRVRITAQLIEARSDTNLWSDVYDRELGEIFAIQDEIAQEVVARLKVTLLGGPPTVEETSSEAYTLYLRGNEYFNRGLGDPSVVIAADMYEEAVNLDPTFVLSHVALAKASSRIIFQGIDASQKRHDQARQALETAVRLDPELPAVLAAHGWYYYWALGDFETALKWFRSAYAKLPNDAELLSGMGLAERRLGLWNDALAHLALSFNLDPLSNQKAHQLGISFAFAHNYTEAVEHLQAAIALRPDHFLSYAYLADVLIAKGESFDSALQALREGGDVIGRDVFIRRMLAPNPSWASQMLLLSAFPKEFEELEFESLSRLQAINYLVLSAEQNRREGRTDSQHEAAVALLELIGDRADLLNQSAGVGYLNHLVNQWAGFAYAHLGRKEEAERFLSVAPEKFKSNARIYQDDVMMEAYGELLLGDRDAAIERLDHALSVPGIHSVETILVSPVWRDLRNHDGLPLLKSKYGH